MNLFRSLRRVLPAALAAATTVLACGKVPPEQMAHPVTAPQPGDGTLHAGFARVDITPPPGPGMLGWGPDGVPARGHRTRLFARAMVLQDARGERLAFVVADLNMVSERVQRRVASITDTAAGIGADRLFISATHTHSGPANFMGVRGYDQVGSGVTGYDSTLADTLVKRMARAVMAASRESLPARAAWGVDQVWGVSRIRDTTAFLRNGPPPEGAPAGLPREQRWVDPRWAMLRVDVRDERGWHPRGAYSVFAVHSTAIPEENDLYDADLHGIVSRAVETHIDAINRDGSFGRPAVHLMANSAEGDVSPAFDLRASCQVPRLSRARRGTGPRTPPAHEGWALPPDHARETCLQARKAWATHLGGRMGVRAVALFDRIGRQMETGGGVREIARVFDEVNLDDTALHLCADPVIGPATAAGGEDGYSRLLHFRLLIFGRPFGTPVDTTRAGEADGAHCQRPKDATFTTLIRAVGGRNSLPRRAQYAVIRIGGVVLAAWPYEATTTTGRHVRAAMQPALSRLGISPDSTFGLGLTNGYLYYLATRREYGLQIYEGSGTLYGPASEDFLKAEITKLAERLPPSGRPSPPATLQPATAYPWGARRILPKPGGGITGTPRILRYRVDGDSALVLRWRGAPHARWAGEAAVLRVMADGPGAPRLVTWDDDPEVELRARSGPGEWEARWTPCVVAEGSYRLVLVARDGLEEWAGAPLHLPARRCVHRPPGPDARFE